MQEQFCEGFLEASTFLLLNLPFSVNFILIFGFGALCNVFDGKCQVKFSTFMHSNKLFLSRLLV